MNLKPYYLQTLNIKNKQGKLVPARLFNYEHSSYVVFHADVKKLLFYYKFACNAIPSFINEDKYKPILAYNPIKINSNCNIIQSTLHYVMEFFGIYNHWSEKQIEFKYQEIDFFKTNLMTYGNKTYEQVYKTCLVCEDINKEPCLELPIFSINYGNFSIETLKIVKYFGLEITQRQIIEHSNIAIEPIDGNHRLRALEALGAKDIFIKIPKSQINEFASLCGYKSIIE